MRGPKSALVTPGWAMANPALSAEHAPGEALVLWLGRYAELLEAKRGLASALHSGEPMFEALRAYFFERMSPTLEALLDAAAASGEVRDDVATRDLLSAVAKLCMPVRGEGPERSRRMVAVLLDGLRRT